MCSSRAHRGLAPLAGIALRTCWSRRVTYESMGCSRRDLICFAWSSTSSSRCRLCYLWKNTWMGYSKWVQILNYAMVGTNKSDELLVILHIEIRIEVPFMDLEYLRNLKRLKDIQVDIIKCSFFGMHWVLPSEVFLHVFREILIHLALLGRQLHAS